tara:strand:+ start:4067 stop:4459 length:393 start_codon:yes stop_codon:yes gene_type:complete
MTKELSKEEFDKKFNECVNSGLQSGHVEQFVMKRSVQKWSNEQLSRSFEAMMKNRPNAVFQAILNERNGRQSNRLFKLSLFASITIPLISLVISIWFSWSLSRNDSNFEKAWLEQQNKNHAEMIKVLKIN